MAMSLRVLVEMYRQLLVKIDEPTVTVGMGQAQDTPLLGLEAIIRIRAMDGLVVIAHLTAPRKCPVTSPTNTITVQIHLETTCVAMAVGPMDHRIATTICIKLVTTVIVDRNRITVVIIIITITTTTTATKTITTMGTICMEVGIGIVIAIRNVVAWMVMEYGMVGITTIIIMGTIMDISTTMGNRTIIIITIITSIMEGWVVGLWTVETALDREVFHRATVVARIERERKVGVGIMVGKDMGIMIGMGMMRVCELTLVTRTMQMRALQANRIMVLQVVRSL